MLQSSDVFERFIRLTGNRVFQANVVSGVCQIAGGAIRGDAVTVFADEQELVREHLSSTVINFLSLCVSLHSTACPLWYDCLSLCTASHCVSLPLSACVSLPLTVFSLLFLVFSLH